MSRSTASLTDKISSFLTKPAGNGQDMEEWLYEKFPKGLGQMTEHFNAKADPIKEMCDDMFDSKLQGKHFARPEFDEEYTRVQRFFHEHNTPMMVARAEAFDSLSSYKKLYDKTSSRRVFFEQEFLPRIKELKAGAPYMTHDYELFYLARMHGKGISNQYKDIVNGDAKPQAGTYAAYMHFLNSVLDTMPKPPDWNTRLINLTHAEKDMDAHGKTQ